MPSIYLLKVGRRVQGHLLIIATYVDPHLHAGRCIVLSWSMSDANPGNNAHPVISTVSPDKQASWDIIAQQNQGWPIMHGWRWAQKFSVGGETGALTWHKDTTLACTWFNSNPASHSASILQLYPINEGCWKMNTTILIVLHNTIVLTLGKPISWSKYLIIQ